MAKDELTCAVCNGEGGQVGQCDSRHLECDGETHQWWEACQECEGTGGVMCVNCGTYNAVATVHGEDICQSCAKLPVYAEVEA